MNQVKIFSGSSDALAHAICKELHKPLGKATVDKFPDGETKVEIDENVRGYDIFVVQSTCPPVNDNLMQLLILIDALRRASPKRITAVVPYFGYSRQDRKHAPREPITAKLVADLIEVAGPARLLFLDLHSDQIQGFFNLPVDNLLPDTLFEEFINEKQLKKENTVIVSPDVGGARRARRIAQPYGFKIALLEPRSKGGNDVVEKAESMNVVGELAENAVIVDDMVDTGRRLILASNTLRNNGVKHIYACCTHALFSADVQTIQDSEVEEVVVTDSVGIPPEKRFKKLRIISIAPLFAEAIRRIHNEEPLGEEAFGTHSKIEVV